MRGTSKKASLWDFKIGDIITSDIKQSSWYGEKIKVKRFNLIPGKERLWGKSKSIKTLLYASVPLGLILLERPSLAFKVGDDVEIIACPLKSGLVGKKGKVIIIDPRKHFLLPFLVELKKCVFGHAAPLAWKNTWYSKKHKTESRSRFWFRENELKKI